MKKIENVVVERIDNEELTSALDIRFTTYAFMSLEDRALPDARDGLKPSQRRILVAMNDLNLSPNSATQKSAKICGDASANYHPHGEAVVYPTMYRLAQPWIMREPVINGQGNFGNIDGDPPAAMRYTEAKLSSVGEALLDDLSEDVVPFVLNYNERLKEPTVLPAKFPNLLVNGAEGIAVGWATKLPPHNLREVSNAIKLYLKNKDVTVKEIMKVLPGPDFPTGGKLLGQDGVVDYFTVGKGQLKLEGKWEIEKNLKGVESIVITELPYQSSPEGMASEIENLVKNEVISGITDLKNLSSKKGIRLVIECSKSANTQIILNGLLKHSSLRRSFSVNQTVLIDGKVVPDVGVVKLIKAYVDHRIEILGNKYKAEKAKHLSRIHILEGLIKAVQEIDKVIKIVRTSDDAEESLIKENIVNTKEQAKAVLAITLSQLTKMEQSKLIEERDKKEERIKWLTKVLDNSDEIDNIIAEELDELSKKFGSERKTEIVKSVQDLNIEDLVENKQLVVSLTGDGYVRSTPSDEYTSQKRGGKGVIGTSKEESNVFEMFEAHSKDLVLFFTTKGLVYRKRVYEIPENSKTAKGVHVSNMLNLAENEQVTNMVSFKSLDDGGYLVIVTKKGLIKRTDLKEYDTSLKNAGLTAIKLADDDQVAFVLYTNGKKHIFAVTENGLCVRYAEDVIPVQGRSTQGSRAFKLNHSDNIAQVISLDANEKPNILVVTRGGYGKKTDSSEYKAFDNRQVKGYAVINKVALNKIGLLAGAVAVYDNDSVLVLTTKGKMIRIKSDDIKPTGRTTIGVKVVKLEDGDSIAKIAKLQETDIVVE